MPRHATIQIQAGSHSFLRSSCDLQELKIDPWPTSVTSSPTKSSLLTLPRLPPQYLCTARSLSFCSTHKALSLSHSQVFVQISFSAEPEAAAPGRPKRPLAGPSCSFCFASHLSHDALVHVLGKGNWERWFRRGETRKRWRQRKPKGVFSVWR